MKEMPTPSVSVIIPTYNRQDYVMLAISSVLEQTYTDFELLIIDDGSTDETANLIENIDDQRIRYHYLDHTGKVSAIRNIGLDLAKGKYIAFLDSDDTWLLNKLELQVRTLDLNPGCFALSKPLINKSKGVNDSASTGYYRKNLFMDIIKNRATFYPSGLVFPRTCLEKVSSFDTKHTITEMEFIGRLSAHYEAIVFDQPLIAIKRHGKNTSTQVHSRAFGEKFLLLDKMLDEERITQREFREAKAFHLISYAVLPGLGFWAALRTYLKVFRYGYTTIRIYPLIFRMNMKRYFWGFSHVE